jgi:glutamate--cysteine ligase
MSAHHPEGTLAQTDHPEAWAALTHANITTDYSESLLEFITPATDSIESLIEQLGDIHRHTIHHLGEERIWPSPCPASSATRRTSGWPSTAAPTSGG